MHVPHRDLEGLFVQPDGASTKVAYSRDSASLYRKAMEYLTGSRWMSRQCIRHRAGRVLVYSPDGTLLGRILTGVPTANVAFGEDGATLFITANHRVLRLRTLTKGMPLPADQ